VKHFGLSFKNADGSTERELYSITDEQAQMCRAQKNCLSM